MNAGGFVKVTFDTINFSNNTVTVKFNDGAPFHIPMRNSSVNGLSQLVITSDDKSHVWLDEISIV